MSDQHYWERHAGTYDSFTRLLVRPTNPSQPVAVESGANPSAGYFLNGEGRMNRNLRFEGSAAGRNRKFLFKCPR